MGKSSGSIWVSLGLKTSEFTKGIKRSRKELTGFQKFGQGLKGMFNPMTVGIGVVAGLGAALTDAFGIFKSFEKANSDLAAVLGATDSEMKALSDQAKELGGSTAFTATEVSELQKEFAKLGFDSGQIRNMTEATLNLAAAAGVELSEAASMAGSTMNAFGLKSSDATHVTDVMAKSFASSALDMTKLSETMKMAAPIAKATGVSFEVATAAAGKLADANISGSVAGTALKRIFSELVKDGKPFQESLNDIAKEMNATVDPAEKLAIAEGKVGNIAKGSLLVLVEQKNALGDLATELNNADGSAKAMADTMLDNLTGDMTIARSAWEGFVLSIEDGNGILSGALRGIVQGFTSIIAPSKTLKQTYDGLVDSNKNLAKNITPLIDRHDELKNKTNLTKGEQEELKTIISKISTALPGAITEFDKYGKAIGISGDKSRELVKAQQKLTAFKNKELIEENVKAYEKEENKLIRLNGIYKTTAEGLMKYNREMDEATMGKKTYMKASNDEIAAYQKSLKAIEDNKEALILQKKELQGLELVKKEEAVATVESTDKVVTLTKEQIKLAAATKKTQDNIDLFAASLLATNDKEMNFGGELEGMTEGDNIFDKIIEENTKNLKPIEIKAKIKADSLNSEMKSLGEQLGTSLTTSLKNTAANTITGLGEAIGSGAGIDEVGKVLLNGMSNLLSSFGKQLIAFGIAKIAFNKALTTPLGGPAALAAGIAMVGISSAIQSSLSEASAQPFAAGGLVFGPTMGLVGEGKGTTPSNPEVIAPLDKLKSFMPQGDGMGGKVEFEIKGTNLVGVLNRAGKSAKYSN